MNAEQVYAQHSEIIDNAVRRVGRRFDLSNDETLLLTSLVRNELTANEFAAIRAFSRRSSMSLHLVVQVQRIAERLGFGRLGKRPQLGG